MAQALSDRLILENRRDRVWTPTEALENLQFSGSVSESKTAAKWGPSWTPVTTKALSPIMTTVWAGFGAGLISPKVLKSRRRQLRVADRVLNILVP